MDMTFTEIFFLIWAVLASAAASVGWAAYLKTGRILIGAAMFTKRIMDNPAEYEEHRKLYAAARAEFRKQAANPHTGV